MRAVLFDFDGVLVNSEPLHYRSLRDSLRVEGIEIDEDEYARRYLSYDDWETARLALEQHRQRTDRGRVQAIAERRARFFEQLMREVPFFPGARELVDGLRQAQVPLAIASGALRRQIEEILTVGRLREAFTIVVGAEDVVRGKPHPEPYLMAMDGLRLVAPDLRPDECVVVEDTVAGIAAGRAAGMRVLGVAHTYPPGKLAAAHHVVPSLQDVTAADLARLFA